MSKYRIVKFYQGALEWYRVEKEKETLYRGFEWTKVVESPSFEECERYLNDLRPASSPVVIKEYEF